MNDAEGADLHGVRHGGDRPGSVAVVGATGHTGGFVVDELSRRGLPWVGVGRRPAVVRGREVRVAPLDDAAALAAAFADCAVVVNAAGPFLDTADPVIGAALAAGCHYIDVTAEQESARATLQGWDAPAREAGVVVIPAAGFFGGLADLLAGSLAGDGPIAGIDVAVSLDHWWPTVGTRLTGARNHHPRKVVDDGELVDMAAEPGRPWDFGSPHGIEDVEPVPLSEVVTIAHHLPVARIRSWLSARALADIRDPATPAPVAADALGRSRQRFTMQVVLEDALGVRAATARGCDIYAVSAPMVVAAAERLRSRAPARAGAMSLAAAFDPDDMLRTLCAAANGIALAGPGVAATEAAGALAAGISARAATTGPAIPPRR